MKQILFMILCITSIAQAQRVEIRTGVFLPVNRQISFEIPLTSIVLRFETQSQIYSSVNASYWREIHEREGLAYHAEIMSIGWQLHYALLKTLDAEVTVSAGPSMNWYLSTAKVKGFSWRNGITRELTPGFIFQEMVKIERISLNLAYIIRSFETVHGRFQYGGMEISAGYELR